jgi:RNA polymerase sigma factor (sigma-70 family)
VNPSDDHVPDALDRQEVLADLFGTVFGLAGQVASRIGPGEVDARLRRTLRKADHHRTQLADPRPERQADEKAVSGSSVGALVAGVGDGDRDAWNELIERYAPLVWSICARYQLSRPDIDDVGQNVWLLLVENIGKLRDPAALPGWLATTTRHECLRVLRAARRHDHADLPPEEQIPLDPDAATIEQEVIEAERNAALRAAFAELAPNCHELLSLLITDPPLSYADISARLGLAIGSIGPTRARCLERLRRSLHLTAILGDGATHAEVAETRNEVRGTRK